MRRRLGGFALADIDVVAFAVKAIDDKVMPVVDFVAQPRATTRPTTGWGGSPVRS
nr:hypothetical protein [Mesorhizobium sp. M8A.F.Ca.ET.161.01.1.1]